MTTGLSMQRHWFANTAMVIMLSFIVWVMSGCVGQPAVPQDYFYRLPAIHPSSPLDSKLINGSVSVDEFDADGVYRERPLLYVDAERPLEVLQYHYRHWIQIPTQLIQENFIDYLREANVADNVGRFSSGLRQDLLIKGRLHKFERLVDKGRYLAVAEIEIELRKKGQQETIKPPKVYTSRKSAQGPAVHDSVTAFGEALQQIYENVLEDLRSIGE